VLWHCWQCDNSIYVYNNLLTYLPLGLVSDSWHKQTNFLMPPVMDKEGIRPSHRLWSVLWISFCALSSAICWLSGRKHIWPVKKCATYPTASHLEHVERGNQVSNSRPVSSAKLPLKRMQVTHHTPDWTTHTHTTVVRPFFSGITWVSRCRKRTSELYFMVQGKINISRHTVKLGATPSD